MGTLMIQLAAIVASNLPEPPRPPPPTRDDTLENLLIVGAILAIIVAVAWVLKPLVARRLPVATNASADDSSDQPPPDRADWPNVWRADSQPSAPDQMVSPGPIDAETEFVGQDVRGVDAPAPDGPPIEPVIPEPDIEHQPAPAPSWIDPDVEVMVEVTLTVRELLSHANQGQPLRGFALYSESYLRRFREDSGLTEEEFIAAFAEMPPPPPEARTDLAAVTDLTHLGDDRLSAVIAYANGGQPPPPERYVFVRSETGDRWLIDDILSVGAPFVEPERDSSTSSESLSDL